LFLSVIKTCLGKCGDCPNVNEIDDDNNIKEKKNKNIIDLFNF